VPLRLQRWFTAWPRPCDAIDDQHHGVVERDLLDRAIFLVGNKTLELFVDPVG
jgi:hypothetical protein